MKIKLVKTKTSNKIFYVKYNEKFDIWERIDNEEFYYTDDLIFI